MRGGAPSTHILKLANHEFKGLTWNEGYSSFLAARLGVPCVEVLVKDGYTLTKRYDRVITESGTIRRIHQEDFCQALGYPSYIKYESEKGPSLQDCIAMMRQASIVPAADALVLLHWNICNLLLGNSDGHAKNLGMNPRLVLRTLQELIESIEDRLELYHNEFIETMGSDPVIDRINQTIRKQARRTKTLLGSAV